MSPSGPLRRFSRSQARSSSSPRCPTWESRKHTRKGVAESHPFAPQPSLLGITGLFTRYANTTFGGGSATIAVLHRELERRRWINSDQFAISFSLARLTPGTNLLAFCTSVGWLLRGIRGAIAALLASSIPCAAIVVVATAMFDVWQRVSWAKAFVHGAVAAAVALTVATSWTIARPYFRPGERFLGGLIVSAAFLLHALVGLSAISVLGLAAAVGLMLPAKRS